MNAPVRAGELLNPDDVIGAFFAPAATDLVHGLVAQYKQARQRIEAVAAFANGPEATAVLHYFLDGNATEDRGRTSLSMSAAQLFQTDGAVAALNAAFWSKALSLTDVYDAMPQDRRTQWNEQIRNPQGRKVANKHTGEKELPRLPDFEEETVRATLMDLLNSRARFLAERVDGIFRALSGEHVTNSPAGFGKRMIIASLVTSYGTTAWERVGYINDLRCVIAKFMGRDELKFDASTKVAAYARLSRRGEWVTLDGGALRLRAYKCGTAHLEVHPDMAWRLNCILSNLYPLAIPAEFRTKPKKPPKDFVMMGRPLPFAVTADLERLKPAVRLEKSDDWRREYNHIRIPNSLAFEYGSGANKAAREEAERVLSYIGGVKTQDDRGGFYYAFDYHPGEVLDEIICSGCLPDQKTHQYYPTPANVAEAVMQRALENATPVMKWCEPQAGTGGLADLMPKDQTLCVEISALHCKVLEAKGFNVVHGDFLKWSPVERFDRIVMNPPFSEGRWLAHLEHASTLLAPNGELHAVLPASAKGKDVLPGWSCEWSTVFKNEFAGTSVDVVILVAERQQ